VRGWGAWFVAAVAPVLDLADVVTHLVLSLDLSLGGDGEEAALGKACPTHSSLPGLLQSGLLMRSCEVCRCSSRSLSSSFSRAHLLACGTDELWA
jgi:hypothetical protein